MIVADAGQRPDSWRVERIGDGTSSRWTETNPMGLKNGAASVVAR
jgi:hypothetical protein